MACATLKRSLDLDPLQSPRPTKRRRCAPVGTSPMVTPTRAGQSSITISPFVTGRLSKEAITTHVREEMQRLIRRKQLHFGDVNSVRSISPTTPSVNTGAANVTTTPTYSKQVDEGRKDKPLFTFQQVGLICERMVREREQELREMYENVLATKLAEQYDAFVKFTYDQIHKQHETSAPPSYLS